MSSTQAEPVKLSRSVLETELLLASQMRTASLVLGAYAHDARTPLNAMQLSLELLAGTLDNPTAAMPGVAPPWQRHISVLREECGKLNRTLQALIDQQQPLGSAKQTFDLRNVVHEVIGLLRGRAARQRVQLSTECPDAAAMVEGSRDRLKQAVLNVTVHALDCMKRSGDEPGRLRVQLKNADQQYQLLVHHTGESTSAAGLASCDGSLPALWAARLTAESHGGGLFVEAGTDGERLAVSLPRAREAL